MFARGAAEAARKSSDFRRRLASLGAACRAIEGVLVAGSALSGAIQLIRVRQRELERLDVVGTRHRTLVQETLSELESEFPAEPVPSTSYGGHYLQPLVNLSISSTSATFSMFFPTLSPCSFELGSPTV